MGTPGGSPADRSYTHEHPPNRHHIVVVFLCHAEQRD
jgi:hypothetical protein